ncbi:hypothetical protein KM043_008447 [Ampulex compressa]|nr:hypothetical protein KM043_008447 [Ampulex compressa]
MTTVCHVLRGVQSARRIFKTATKVPNFGQRLASTMTRTNFVEGENGERIVRSPYGDYIPTDALITDFVWKNVNEYSNKIALECALSKRRYTYAESRDAANYVGRSLLSMGLKEGDVVALVAPNYPETILGFLGILEAGLVVTTVNPFYTVDEISRQLKSSGAKAVITAAEVSSTALAAARSSLPSDAPFVVIEDKFGVPPEGTIPFKDLIARGKSLPPINRKSVSPDDLAVLPYSSGTTGMPKGVMLSHRNLVSNAEMTEISSGKELWAPTTDSYQCVLPVVLPFFHIFGMNVVTLPRLAAGCKLITIPKFLPETFIDVLENYEISGLYCVPPIVLFLSATPLAKKKHLDSMNVIFSGAAPLSEGDVMKVYEKFGIDKSALQFRQGYGLTECSPVAFTEKSGAKYASIGRNIIGCDVRLVDPITNEDVSTPGQTGELWVRGPHVMKGYLNNEAATRETVDRDGWLKTGDIAYFDDDFDFFITDRLKELIKVKGFQVPPAELEALLRTHPNVAEAAVIGIPDEKCGEVPKAFVIPKAGKKLGEDEVKNFVKGKVSEYKQLRGGVVFVDNIPKNPSGKILRSQLKKEYLS